MQPKNDANSKLDIDSPFEDEDILDLADDLLNDADGDLFSMSEASPADDQADDDILDLTDVVGEADSGEEDIMDLTDIAAEDDAGDDDILELEDIVEDDAAEPVEPMEPDKDVTKATEDMDVELTFDDDILDLGDSPAEDLSRGETVPTQSSGDASADTPDRAAKFALPESELTLDGDIETAVELSTPETAPPTEPPLTDTMDLADVAPATIEEAFKLDPDEGDAADAPTPSFAGADTDEDGVDLDLEGSTVDDGFTIDLDQSDADTLETGPADPDQIVLDETLDLSDLEREINSQDFELEFDTDDKSSPPPAADQYPDTGKDDFQFKPEASALSDTLEDPPAARSDDILPPPAPAQTAEDAFDLSAFEEADEEEGPDPAAGQTPADSSELPQVDEDADAADDDPEVSRASAADESFEGALQEDSLIFDDLDREILKDDADLDFRMASGDETPAADDDRDGIIEEEAPRPAPTDQSEADFIESLGMTIESEVDMVRKGDDAGLTLPPATEAADVPLDPPAVAAEPGMAESTATAPAVAMAAGGPGEAFSDEQLEAAIENVVHRMFSEKIETILNRVIEQTVTREIERLKRLLLEDAGEEH